MAVPWLHPLPKIQYPRIKNENRRSKIGSGAQGTRSSTAPAAATPPKAVNSAWAPGRLHNGTYGLPRRGHILTAGALVLRGKAGEGAARGSAWAPQRLDDEGVRRCARPRYLRRLRCSSAQAAKPSVHARARAVRGHPLVTLGMATSTQMR